MVTFHNILHFFHHTASPSETVAAKAPSVAEQPKSERVKSNIEGIWHRFLVALRFQPKSSAAEAIRTALAKVDIAEKGGEQKPVVISLLRQAFTSAIKAMQSSKIDPKEPPKAVAQACVELLCRFGIAIYANNDVEQPFQCSLDILKTALVVQEYALGLRKTCPDLTQAGIIDDLYANEALKAAAMADAEASMRMMDRDLWMTKAAELTQMQQTQLALILRYANGAMNYLEMEDFDRSERLLLTAEGVLRNCQLNPAFDKVEADNQMAELIYNELTGLYADKAEKLEKEGKIDEAKATRWLLSQMWDQCISLSKEPEMMRARCDNKRCFVEKLTPEEELALRTASLKKHLSMPEEKQNKLLIALSFHNLSCFIEENGLLKEAVKLALQAMDAVSYCRKKGENNVQFDIVENHTKLLLEKAIKVMKEKDPAALEGKDPETIITDILNSLQHPDSMTSL